MKGKIILAALLVVAAAAVAGSVTKIYIEPGGERMVFSDGATLDLADGAAITNAIGAGTVVSTTGLSVVETGDGVVHKTTFTIASGYELVEVDSGANGGHASTQLYDFPAGYIKFIGSVLDVDVSCGTTGLTATATYDFGLGTAATGTSDAALSTTEQNVLTKIEGDLSGAAAALGSAYATDVAADGTSTAANLYFNAAFEANDASADEVCTISGTVIVTWVNLGDY